MGRYVRALGAFYLRLVGKPLDVYSYLEPLLNDYRKLRVITGSKMASHIGRDLKVCLHGLYQLLLCNRILTFSTVLREPAVSGADGMGRLRYHVHGRIHRPAPNTGEHLGSILCRPQACTSSPSDQVIQTVDSGQTCRSHPPHSVRRTRWGVGAGLGGAVQGGAVTARRDATVQHDGSESDRRPCIRIVLMVLLPLQPCRCR
jgi:hypothetical protein